MASRKHSKTTSASKGVPVDTAFYNTDSGPASPPDKKAKPAGAVEQARAKGQMGSAIPFNADKATEYGRGNAHHPVTGSHLEPPSSVATASTLSEINETEKTGSRAGTGFNAANGELSRVRADSSGQPLTTNQGVKVSDNQNSLKAGIRGPALLKDFVLREKITHFDHERIPERVVHARGSAAHGYFECYTSLQEITAASVFSEPGKVTPVFARFSTVAGERGSKDTARDVRGFAVKLYTDEGNWDLVGNNMPVFFIQDAMKFPDLVHAVKPEPHHGMPQAASAHDTFWDFVSLVPESTHTLLWLMSDRAIPRSLRMMQGFGVHTFRFVNRDGNSVLVKFHWSPLLGTHSLVWDEAVKISGADPDFHRRDLWEAINSGNYPEWELGVQIFTEEQADQFSFDVLDATKLIPEELIPVTPIGRMVLNRNPDNFFAETEQVAFCTAHVVPGIDFTNDPLLAGRIHSYVDTQISRLGGPNFHELPINASLAPVHNNQRDGMHRQAIHRGGVSYEPNSLAGGCPFQAGATGFVSFPEPTMDDELRGKPEKFAEHYNQATLFYDSQSDPEKKHIIQAFRFELSKVTVSAIRERTVSMLRNVSEDLAHGVAQGLGMTLPNPMPKAIKQTPKPEITISPALSLTARPGNGTIHTRKVAILVSDQVDGACVMAVADALISSGAVVRFVGPRVGVFETADGQVLDADASIENNPSCLFDGVVIPEGLAGIQSMISDGRTKEFIRDQFRHSKTILSIGSGSLLLEAAGIPKEAVKSDGMFHSGKHEETVMEMFIHALSMHRHFTRESDPPLV